MLSGCVFLYYLVQIFGVGSIGNLSSPLLGSDHLPSWGRIDVGEKFPPSLAITFLMKGVTGGFVVVRRKVASVLLLY